MLSNDLDLNLLVVLSRLAREGSVSQVAQSLGVSASAVSKALGRLREHFEDPLFVSMPNGMAPTPFCEALLPRIAPVVATLADLAHLRPVFDPARSTRTFQLACSDYTFTVFVAVAVRRLRLAAPRVGLRCILTNEQTPDLMRSGAIDFAIVPRERQVDDHPTEALFDDDFSCLVWEDNELVGETLSLETFLASHHVSTMLGVTPIPHLQDEAFQRNGLKPHVAIWAPNFTSVAEAVVGTNLIATMHSRAARLAAKRLPVRLLPPPVPLRPFTEMLQWHRRATLDPGIGWMRALLLEVARDLP